MVHITYGAADIESRVLVMPVGSLPMQPAAHNVCLLHQLLMNVLETRVVRACDLTTVCACISSFIHLHTILSRWPTMQVEMTQSCRMWITQYII